MQKSIQYFTDEYLERCCPMTPEAIVDFLEDFRKMLSISYRAKPVSMIVPEDLLSQFSKPVQKANTKMMRNKQKQ